MSDLDHGTEVMLDFLAAEADNHDDDDILDLTPRMNVLADLLKLDRPEKLPLMTAGEIRAKARRARARLAHDDGPSV